MASAVQRLAVRLSPIANCHSQLVATRLRELGLRGEPMISPGLIYNDSAREPTLTQIRPPRVIYVGRHIPDKRVESLPAAIANAREQIPDLVATIFGDGPRRAAVAAERDRLGLHDVIRMPGFVSQEELDAAVQTASCLVNPSAREGYGLVVVESCAAGTPVVLVEGEDNSAVELIETGINGRVAESTSPADLGAAIVDVVTAGEPMRKTTLVWFEEARRTKTVRMTATRILARLEAAVSAAG